MEVKGSCSVNAPLLKLKLSFFFYYCAWYATQPYISVMQTQIVTYHHLAIIFAWGPVASICGSVVTGFLSDKLGDYKIITIVGVILAGAGPFGILWLYYDHQQYQLQFNQFNVTGVNSTLADSLQSDPVAEQPHTFPLIAFFLLMGVFSETSNGTLLDAIGLAVSMQQGADFARQKLWGAPGMALSPVLCGVLVEWVSEYLGYEDDSVAFVIGTVFTMITVPLIAQLNVEVKKNKKSILSTVKHAVVMIDFDFFVLVEIVAGMCYSFHSVYRPVFATDLHASKTLIGLLLTANGIGLMIALSFVKIVIGRLGEANTLVISMLLFSLRFIVFHYLENPFLLLITELADGFCGFTAMIAGSYYAAAEAPPGMLASFNGILSAAILAIGRAIGTSLGSKLIGVYGIRTTYLLGGYLACGTAVLYFFINHFFLRKIREERHQKLAKELEQVTGIENPAAECKEDAGTP